MGRIARYLNQLIIGNVFDAPDVLEAYATDRSVLRIKPKLVALPESTDDVQKLMRFFYQLAAKGIKMPVTVRGSGMDEMGADLGNGVIISTEKLNRLLESDKRERLVRVQAGITLKELNTALSLNGLTVPIGGHDNETIGGLISNCPSDDFAGKYGGIMAYVEKIEAVLPNGEVVQTDRLNAAMMARKGKEKTLEGKVYSRLGLIVKNHRDLINELRKNNLDSYGYPTIAQAARKNTLDLMPLFFGAEGTLGIITEVIVRAVPMATKTARVVATFEDFKTAATFLEVANNLKPRELNVYDLRVIKTAEETGKRLGAVTGKMESGFVVYGKFDKKPKSCLKKIAGVRKVLPASSQLILESAKNATVLGEFENSLTSFLGQVRSGERVPILTDFYLPGENLPGFIEDSKILEASLKLDLAIFGSYASANYSLRPKFKMNDKEFSKKAMMLLRTGAFIIGRQNGSLTGGSPEGRVKAMVTNAEMPEPKRRLYSEIKDIFDRYGIMNPDVKLGADAKYTVRHFRDDTINPLV